MTRLDPSLRLSRLVVIKSGQRAYDEEFHAGVNIIRGVPGRGNSVGKSTIADMIFYALGGDLTTWKPEAASCDLTLAEVLINGATITLRREITETGQQPMWFYFGDLDAATSSGVDDWQRYTYRRVSDRESFTQVLFRLMGMPEVPAEAEANITMHQLLRLMYVDQMTPVDRIFRFERNDSALRRQAVGDLLCGAFDDRLYPAQLELREKEKSYEAASQQYNALHRVLAAGGEAFNLDIVIARHSRLASDIEATRKQVLELKAHRFDDSSLPASEASVVTGVKAALDKVNADISAATVELSQIRYGIEDASALIDEMQRTLVRLREGEVVNASLGSLDFQFCPSCFAPLSDAAGSDHCKLCHSPVEAEADRSRIARMRNELELQFKESTQLQEGRREALNRVASDISKMTALRDRLAIEYLNLSQNYLTESDARIDSLNMQLGSLERELVDLQRERRIAEQLQELSEQRAQLNEQISRLKHNIDAWKGQRDRRQGEAYRLVQSNTATIIGNDLHTEAEFTSESDVYFNFAEDRITVNGKTGFSASSLTVLRNAFHLALHWASCINSGFKYPRFLLLDNIEDKGMTEERSQTFQKLIVSISDQISVEHQIIFTTSMISADLEESDMTVGEQYSFDNKSLKIGVKNDGSSLTTWPSVAIQRLPTSVGISLKSSSATQISGPI